MTTTVAFNLQANNPIAAPNDRPNQQLGLVFPEAIVIPVLTKTSLLKDKKIDVIYRNGLTAIVHSLDSAGKVVSTSGPLPLIGIPNELNNKDSIHLVQKGLARTHLVPEKGVDGCENRVTVHVSGDGGGKASIPFQPGLALGSVVRGETIQKMEDYATKISALEERAKQIQDAQQKIESYGTQMEAYQGGKAGDTPLYNLYQKLRNAEIERIETLTKELDEAKLESVPTFENFYSTVESPIDKNSPVVVQPRGFDSETFNSQYIDLEENISEIHDRVSHASSASQVSGSGSFLFVSASASHAWANATSNRIAQIKKSKNAQGVLVINSVVTTRNVRCFESIQFDRSRVRSLLDAMDSNNPELMRKYGITVTDKGVEKRKEIYVLTEAILGGSFSAIVTFLKSEDMKRRIEKNAQERSSSTSGSVGVFGFGGSYSNSSASGSQSEDDVLRGISETRVNIEFISQGALPEFQRETLEREIWNHIDLNPAKFELSSQDVSDAKTIATGKIAEKIEIMAKRQMKMQNAQVGVLNTVRGLTSSKEQVQLHTPNSILGAHGSFNDKMANDPDCGVPIGFNYQVLTEDNLREILKELDIAKAKQRAAENLPEAEKVKNAIPAPNQNGSGK